ncbi:hypothetical protein [Rosenbergiella nectarea]|uniref:hypothetical protein n=1 Tax=Rosenbergiella nectarea TaxID=988801 RepID=UPI001BD9BA11|nr:hypothetical protein [Rosenbergiella nectarea]MBT0728991.1 hypothetical protein [Rosenbergiella nectarea subsp. apis]
MSLIIATNTLLPLKKQSIPDYWSFIRVRIINHVNNPHSIVASLINDIVHQNQKVASITMRYASRHCLLGIDSSIIDYR